MKFRILSLCLLLSTLVWSQSPSQTETPTPVPQSATTQSQKGCPCCKNMADKKSSDDKDGMSCCHQNMAAKGDRSTMSCGKGGKCAMAEGKMCMKSKDGKTAQCGKDCCGDKQSKGCCMHKQGDEAMACCGSGQCGESHSHAEPGN